MLEPHYVSETQTLRRIVHNPDVRYIWTSHALAQMEKRKITAADVENALMKGQVILQEQKRDVLWRVRGQDIDGGKIEVVISADEESITIKVVTAI